MQSLCVVGRRPSSRSSLEKDKKKAFAKSICSKTQGDLIFEETSFFKNEAPKKNSSQRSYPFLG